MSLCLHCLHDIYAVLHAMQALAASLIKLQAVTEPHDIVRLMWRVERLVFDDLHEGTKWGSRRRRWFSKKLEAANTLSQV